jgi:hypothetical protein
VARIELFKRALIDQQASQRQRLEALKYLVHFIFTSRFTLRTTMTVAGTKVTVTFMGRQTNLHTGWDTGIIEPAVKGDERKYAFASCERNYRR